MTKTVALTAALAVAASFAQAAPPAALRGGVRADVLKPDLTGITDPNAKAAAEKVLAAFAAFRDENDRALAGKAVSAETNEKLDRINAALDTAQAEFARINATLAAGGPSAGRQIRDAEYSKAFAGFMGKGDVQASLNKGASDQGGYLAPIEWDRTIIDKLVEVSPMRQIAQVQTISTAGFKKLVNLRGTGSGWVGETALRPETNTPTLAELPFTTGEIYANPSATQQLLDDAEVDLEQWLANEVETEFSYQEGIAFVSGNGVNKPNGFLTYVTGASNANANPLGAIGTNVSGSATVISTDEIVDLIYSLPSSYLGGARFVMNRGTQGRIRKLKDGQGNYIWQPSFTSDQPATLAGYPITEMPAMPNVAAGAVPLAFGDFRRGYLILDRVGVRVIRDPYTNKPFVMFYTTKRVGGGVQNTSVLKALKMAAA